MTFSAGDQVIQGGIRRHGGMTGGRRAVVVAIDTVRAPSSTPVDVVLVEYPRGRQRWVFATELRPA